LCHKWAVSNGGPANPAGLVATERLLGRHLQSLRACVRCPNMIGPVVVGQPVVSPVLLIGQAPGAREGVLGRPFAWTAGKQLFKWFAGLGVGEPEFRARVYMAAVCRCFPGKRPRGGDREPGPEEIDACSHWLDREIELLRPRLVLPVGRLAIASLLGPAPLADVIGRLHRARRAERLFDVIPLPHPSGASTWWKRDPGKGLLALALGEIERHPAWRMITTARG
jgi:uracil-DNA glycosylase